MGENNGVKRPGQLPAEPSIGDVVEMEKETRGARTAIDLLSVRITNVAGSGAVILVHLIWFSLWLALNLHLVPGVSAFDPFPFSFLTMIVSLEAIFLTLFVLVSQNRMAHESDKRSHLDLQINILAERETTLILRMLTEIAKKLDVKSATRSELAEYLKETPIAELARKLDKALPAD